MPRPLQTRQIGLRPHHSGHPLAPMEIVYEVEAEPLRARFSRFCGDSKPNLNPYVTVGLWVYVAVCAAYIIWKVLTN